MSSGTSHIVIGYKSAFSIAFEYWMVWFDQIRSTSKPCGQITWYKAESPHLYQFVIVCKIVRKNTKSGNYSILQLTNIDPLLGTMYNQDSSGHWSQLSSQVKIRTISIYIKRWVKCMKYSQMIWKSHKKEAFSFNL